MARGESDREVRFKATLFREEQQARQWNEGDLQAHRVESLNYYNREPIGDEQPGQSSIVTSEYADTVESIMPPMMRVFTSGDSVVEFTPDNPGDEQFAEEATSYVPHVLMRENAGFESLYWFIKDALMYRLAWLGVDIEEVEEVKSKAFGPLPGDQFALLSQQATEVAEKLKADVEIEATEDGEKQTQASVDYGKGMPEAHCGICKHFTGTSCELVEGSISPDMWCKLYEQRQPQDPPAQPTTFSGKITTRRTVKRVKIDNIAPEDGLVSPTARNIDEASFVGFRKRVTASELKVMGLSEDEIDDLSSDELYTVEQSQRQPDVVQAATERDTRDDSERQYWIVVAYVRFDWDGDGKSEMLRVLYAHAGGQVSSIIEGPEEWTDGIAPIVAGSPILMSHTIPGKSIFDQVKDIQQIGTALTRGMLDNLYLSNRPRPAVSDNVDLASLIDWTPGMPIRMRQGALPTQDNLTWVQVPTVMDKALAANQWKDELLHRRTGVTPNAQGVLDENMNPTAQGAALATSAADARLELIARTLAETSIKRLFRLIYRAIKRAASGPVTYKAMDEWVTVDPTKWPDDMGLDVNVGMGAGNKQQQLQHLLLVGQGQQALIEAQGGPTGPAVKLKHAANTFRKLVQTVGIKATDQYVAADPEIEQGEAQKAANPPPNPEMAKVNAQHQANMAKIEADNQAQQAKNASDIQLAREKNSADLQAKREQAALDMQLAREKAALEAKIAQDKAALDAALKKQEIDQEAALEKYKIDQMPKPGNTEIKEQQV